MRIKKITDTLVESMMQQFLPRVLPMYEDHYGSFKIKRIIDNISYAHHSNPVVDFCITVYYETKYEISELRFRLNEPLFFKGKFNFEELNEMNFIHLPVQCALISHDGSKIRSVFDREIVCPQLTAFINHKIKSIKAANIHDTELKIMKDIIIFKYLEYSNKVLSKTLIKTDQFSRINDDFRKHITEHIKSESIPRMDQRMDELITDDADRILFEASKIGMDLDKILSFISEMWSEPFVDDPNKSWIYRCIAMIVLHATNIDMNLNEVQTIVTNEWILSVQDK